MPAFVTRFFDLLDASKIKQGKELLPPVLRPVVACLSEHDSVSTALHALFSCEFGRYGGNTEEVGEIVSTLIRQFGVEKVLYALENNLHNISSNDRRAGIIIGILQQVGPVRVRNNPDHTLGFERQVGSILVDMMCLPESDSAWGSREERTVLNQAVDCYVKDTRVNVSADRNLPIYESWAQQSGRLTVLHEMTGALLDITSGKGRELNQVGQIFAKQFVYAVFGRLTGKRQLLLSHSLDLVEEVRQVEAEQQLIKRCIRERKF